MDTDKLTIELLAPYLPYKLKFIDINDSHIFDILSMSDDSFSLYSESEATRTIYFHINHFISIKPILRPMIDLTKYLDGPINHLYIINREYNNQDTEFDSMLDFNVEDKNYFNLNDVIGVYNYLLKHHFDVFGLIEKGLAIDINTLDK